VNHTGTDEQEDKKMGRGNVLALRDIALGFGLYFARLFGPARAEASEHNRRSRGEYRSNVKQVQSLFNSQAIYKC
jgi:hypothetical protein